MLGKNKHASSGTVCCGEMDISTAPSLPFWEKACSFEWRRSTAGQAGPFSSPHQSGKLLCETNMTGILQTLTLIS